MTRWTMWMTVGALLASAAVAAPPPNRVNYQGVLRDAAGAPEEGDFDMDFWFFDAEVAGNDILGDQHRAGGTGAVTVGGGLFNVPLGSGDVIDGSGPGTYNSLGDMFGDFGTVWMEIRIGAETLSPRVRVEASPYALNAGSLEGRPSTEFLDTSVNPQIKAGLLQLGGNLTVGGEIAIEGGTPDAGRVLTSDAVGAATWQELPTAQQSELRALSDRLGSEDVSSRAFRHSEPVRVRPSRPVEPDRHARRFAPCRGHRHRRVRGARTDLPPVPLPGGTAIADSRPRLPRRHVPDDPGPGRRVVAARFFRGGSDRGRRCRLLRRLLHLRHRRGAGPGAPGRRATVPRLFRYVLERRGVADDGRSRHLLRRRDDAVQLRATDPVRGERSRLPASHLCPRGLPLPLQRRRHAAVPPGIGLHRAVDGLQVLRRRSRTCDAAVHHNVSAPGPGLHVHDNRRRVGRGGEGAGQCLGVRR